MPPLRGPTRGGWGRLKPVDVDPLEVYGLPSKGETRLADFKVQERFYAKIIERYLQFCTDAKGRDGLLERFASLELAEKKTPSAWSADPPSWSSTSQTSRTPSSSASSAITTPIVPTSASVSALAAASQDLTLVLSALRKLREAIVATDRSDDFATQVYLFCIRLAILAKHPQSYHPALLHLLRSIHRRKPLLNVELQEVASYRVLDAACRRGDLAEAYHLRCLYKLHCTTVDAALYALAHDDWVALNRLLQKQKVPTAAGAAPSAPPTMRRTGTADAYQGKLLEYAVHNMRVHTLKCFGRAYLRLEDVQYLETATELSWADLQSKYSVGWEREGDAVVIRKVQPRIPAAAAPTTAT
ncbi:hypothetical protein F503_03465 [Ophiostoma piceae UAMH 11346]|uniref:Sac3 ganp domain protein n=1 Tax=Ophiostoma piceae (strain UAMH 11346) TaxID=1262450 RepID=S3CKM3_OPHP1|nr:hypothetical protein F503_03465 [Ophiostoma piceae UAMH 11346]